MSAINAIQTTGIDSAAISDDGSKVLLQFPTEQGGNLPLVFPVQELANLMMLASASSSDALKKLTGDQQRWHAYPAQAWDISETADGQHLLFSFTLPGEMRLTFQLSRDAAFNLSDSLNSKLGSIVGAVTKGRS